jgi:hypothetical protein
VWHSRFAIRQGDLQTGFSIPEFAIKKPESRKLKTTLAAACYACKLFAAAPVPVGLSQFQSQLAEKWYLCGLT